MSLFVSFNALAEVRIPYHEVAVRWSHTTFFSYTATPSWLDALPTGFTYTYYPGTGHGWMIDAGYQKQEVGGPVYFNRAYLHKRSFMEVGVKRIRNYDLGKQLALGGFYGPGYRRMMETYARPGLDPFEPDHSYTNQWGLQTGLKLTYGFCRHFNISLVEEAGYFRNVHASGGRIKVTSATGLSGAFSLTTRVALGYRF